MKYSKIALFVLVSVVIVTASSRAQQSPSQTNGDFRIGIGVSLDLGSAASTQES